MRITDAIISPEVEEKLTSKHHVLAYEVEELFQNRPHIAFVENGNVRGQDLYVALGQTDGRRYLTVFFINKGKGRALIISARDMDRKERKHYGKRHKR